MVGVFKLAKINSVADFNIRTIPPRFRQWARMLVEYSNERYALVTNTILNHNMIRDCYYSAINTTVDGVSSFTFNITGRAIRVTEHDLNRIFRFPVNNHVPDLTAQQIFDFFDMIT